MGHRHIEIACPAKVNLFLGAGRRESDGYHGVETVLHALELADVVTLKILDAKSSGQGRSAGLKIELDCDVDLGVPAEDNLACMAARAFCSEFDCLGPGAILSISLIKRIPSQAGLGGGSSNAAGVILGLCRLFDIDPLCEKTSKLASSLGADVPFFLRGGCAYMKGRGDVFAEAFEPLDLPVVLAKPKDRGVSTAKAYAELDKNPRHAASASEILDALRCPSGPERAKAVAAAMHNDFQGAVCAAEPSVKAVFDELRMHGEAQASLLCGSGSCVFAVLESDEEAYALASSLDEDRYWTCATRLCGRPAD